MEGRNMNGSAVALRVLTGALLATLASATHAADCRGTGLLEKTQRFSDLGQQGDGKGIAKLLDDDVIFFNEAGDRGTKRDLASGGSGPPKGISVAMKVEDFDCRRHGDVAVASFIDHQRITGLVQSDARFRSVETWLKEGAAWKMIGSETIALPDDPPAIQIPAAILDEYVGTYRNETGQTYVFTREGDQLLASVDGSPATPQRAEVLDVFFTPGSARFRKIFERDQAGRVVAFVNRHEGHGRLFKRLAPQKS